MADSEHPDQDDTLDTSEPEQGLPREEVAEAGAEPSEGDEEQQKLNVSVQIDTRGACQRHVTVTVPREDIDRYFDKEFTEMMPSAQVPGFRPGRAPRKLVESRFRKQIGERVKANLLMDALSQIDSEEHITPISEPDLDIEAVELPEDGPLTFEYDIEVRPEFDLPQWKGLTVEKPVHPVTDADIDRSLKNLLASRGRLVPSESAADQGDYVTANLTFRHGERILSTAKEETIRVRSTLSFRDGRIEDFDKLMAGVKPGETRKGEARLSDDAPDEALRGQTVEVEFEVLEVKKLELPEMTSELLDQLGGFELEADLRDAIKDSLERRLEYEQRQRARQQITAALVEAADWDLPPDLLRRQSRRELERAVLELQRSGFSESEIRAHENELRQNSLANTARALKEHFILERIAEVESIEAGEEDYDHEISLIARQTGQSARRIRARLEKGGSMDVLRNQIVERKAVDLILEHAKFKEVPFEFETADTEAIDQSACPEHTEIPEAKPGGGEDEGMGRPAEPRMRG
ncbi:MAG: trigger factor [Planctomycetota bacterium]